MPTASNYLCGCGRFMQVQANGVTVEELLEDGQPYKLWTADLWACVECGVEIIADFGATPLAEHWDPRYPELWDRAHRQGRIYLGRCRDERTRT
jgi:hypothetical protein